MSCHLGVPEASITLTWSLDPIAMEFTLVRTSGNGLSWHFTPSGLVSLCEVGWGRHCYCPSRTGKLRPREGSLLAKGGLAESCI